MAVPTGFKLASQAAAIGGSSSLTPQEKSAAIMKLGFYEASPGNWIHTTGIQLDPAKTLKTLAIAIPAVGPVIGEITSAGQNIAATWKGSGSVGNVVTAPTPAPASITHTQGAVGSTPSTTLLLLGGAAILVLVLFLRR